MGTEEHRAIPCKCDHLLTDVKPEFKRMVTNIAGDITENDLDNLKYMCDMTTEKTALDVLRKLQQRGKFAHHNVGPLEELLKSIERCDLVSKYIESYKQKLRCYADGEFA